MPGHDGLAGPLGNDPLDLAAPGPGKHGRVFSAFAAAFVYHDA
jgi:hypothetical protein